MKHRLIWFCVICIQLLNAALGPRSVVAQENPFLYLPFQAVNDVRGYYMATMTSVFDHSNPNYSTDDRRVVMWNGGIFDDDCWSMGYDMIGDPTRAPGTAATPNPCLRQIQSFTDTNNEFPRQWYNGHDGYDWAVSGDVLAAAGGKVTWVGWNLAGKECLGYAVAIDHQNGYRTIYGHLRDGSSSLHRDDTISIGQIIGEVGKTTGCGTSTGLHLHFTVEHWRSSDQSWHVTDPFGWIGGITDPLFSFNEEKSQNLWVDGAPGNYGETPGVAASVPVNGRYLGGAFVIDKVSPAPAQRKTDCSHVVQPALPPNPIGGKRVGVQAGHWLNDSGATASDVWECEVNADIAFQVVAQLREAGYDTTLFSAKGYPGPTDLNDYAGDAFVAIHADNIPGATGYAVCRNVDSPIGAQDNALKAALIPTFGAATGLPEHPNSCHTANAKYYYGLDRAADGIAASTPGVLIEMGYLSSPADHAVLTEQPDKIAAGIVAGVRAFLGDVAPGQPAPGTSTGDQTATALVVDISGSMGGTWQGGVKIESAKQAAGDVVTMIEQESRAGQGAHQIALVSFTTDASLESSLSADYAGMRDAIDRLSPAEDTNLGAGVEVANQTLSAVPAEAKKIVILLSDGMSNTGLANSEILSGPVQAAADAGTCIYTIGFGDSGDIDEDLLHEIAARSGCGTYTYASAPADLARIYIRLRHQSTGDILDEFQGWIAQGETVQIGQVTVPANQGQLNVTLQWPGSRLELLAKDPSGKAVADGQPGVSIAQTARMVNLLVQNPAAGNWQFAAVGADVPEQQLTYNLIASVRAAIATVIPPPPTPMPDEEPPTGGGSAGLLIALMAGILIGVPVVVFSARRRRQVGGVPVSAVAELIGPSGEQLPISDGAVLGRDPDCAIRLLDDAVSRHHARFRYARGTWYIQDLDSSNGTFVNGARVTATALQDGDRIAIGPYELKLWIGL